MKQDDGDYLLRSVDGGGYQFAGLPVFTEPQADQSGTSTAEIHAVMGDFEAGYVVPEPDVLQETRRRSFEPGPDLRPVA